MMETINLLLCQLEESHLEPLYRIQSDKESMQYTFSTDSIEQSTERFLKYAALSNSVGFAPWTIIHKSEQRIIGWGGLNIDPFDPGWGPEVAYFLHPDYWGRGYATELVKASVEYGTGNIGLDMIGAFTHQENKGSIRVLEKVGFTYVRYEPKIDRNYFRFTKSD
jgi:ribosomal-protein-alanine N-acetyltransferase